MENSASVRLFETIGKMVRLRSDAAPTDQLVSKAAAMIGEALEADRCFLTCKKLLEVGDPKSLPLGTWSRPGCREPSRLLEIVRSSAFSQATSLWRSLADGRLVVDNPHEILRGEAIPRSGDLPQVIAVAPLTVGDSLAGLICLEFDTGPRVLAEEESAFLMAAACSLSDSLAKKSDLTRPLLDQFFHLSGAMICIVDASGHFVRLNPAWTYVLGYKPSEMLGKHFLDFVHPEDRVMTETAYRDNLGLGYVRDFRNRYIASDGTIRWLAWNSIFDAEENVFFATAINITSFKETEAHLKLANDRLLQGRKVALSLMEDAQESELRAERANLAKSEFLAMMSHEIRTPLNAIVGFADLLNREEATPPQRESIEAIQKGGETLLYLIEGILDLSKIEAGKLQLDPRPFSLNDCIRAVVLPLSIKAKEKHLDLSYEPSREVPGLVLGDEARIRQILVNLVGNAIKFTEKGGVKVSTALSAPQDVPGKTVIELVVEDTGIGMSSGEIDQIFEPFVQASNHIFRQYGGSGLGLSICRKLAELMNGSISVTSKVGGGSCFRVRLPLGQYMESMPSADQDMHPPAGVPAKEEGLRVLVVDDVPTNLKVCATMLKRRGCDVTCASSGAEAIRFHHEKPFPVIFMDIFMPGLNGIETTQSIRKWETSDPSHPRAHIIALTADAREESRTLCLSSGLDDFLTKPIQMSDISAALGKVAAR